MSGARIDPAAGKLLKPAQLIDPVKLIDAHYAGIPDLSVATQRIHFGTSGHRGSPFDNAFNEAHIIAVAEAVCLYRKSESIDGPLFLGIDTHVLSRPAFIIALEVFVANDVETMIDTDEGFTPTPVISHAILTYNSGRTAGLADGVVLTPSHNPLEDGGFKYNPPDGRPRRVRNYQLDRSTANELLKAGIQKVRRVPHARARQSVCVHPHYYMDHYLGDLADVIDSEAIAGSGLALGIDPLGGASVHYWPKIIDRQGLNGTVVEVMVDPTFGFMTADWDGKIRMDCSSPYAMTRLIGMRDRFDLAFGNDTDADRHGIVTPTGGLMPPIHFLAVAIAYLVDPRPQWTSRCGIGKTMVSSSVIDRIAHRADRPLVEVPVGFKWFVDGLYSGTLGFAGEESAGASLLRRDGSVWTTDKDGLALGLLAAEITARSGSDPNQAYDALTQEFGQFWCERIDAPVAPEQVDVLSRATADRISATELAGEPIEAKLTTAPAGGASLGGIKIITAGGWFAARPSGTESIYKLYAESFRSADHLRAIQHDAPTIVEGVFGREQAAGDHAH